ncbi:MAG: hypothetical protein AAGA66_16955, partial [Bacteroidota bacterium]
GDGYRYTIRKVEEINPDGATSSFTGCVGSETIVNVVGIEDPSAVTVADFDDNTLVYHVSEGGTLGNIPHVSGLADEYIWYENSNATSPVGTPIADGDDMLAATLSGAGFDPSSVTSANENDTTRYHITRIANTNANLGFDGCESDDSPTELSIVVHARQRRPIVTSDNTGPGIPNFVDLNNDGDGTNDDGAVDHYFSICVDQLDNNSLLIADEPLYSGGVRQFEWYQYNNGSGTRIDNIPEFTGTNADFVSLQLASISSTTTRYFELVQVTDIISPVYDGLESDRTLVRIDISQQDALTFQDTNGISLSGNYCRDEDPMGNASGNIVIDLQAGAGSAGNANVSYEVDSYLQTTFDAAGTPEVDGTNQMGNPTLDLDALHDAVVGSNIVGGEATVHTLTMFYTDPVTQCVGSVSTNFTINSRPDIDVTFNDILGDNLEFCYDDPVIRLDGVESLSAAPLSVSGGQFNIDSDLDPMTPADGLTTNNNRAFFDPSAVHDAFHGGGTQPFASQSTHTINFTYTDEFGCPNTVSKTIFVNPRPEIVTGQIQTATSCASGAVELFVEMADDESDYTYEWSVNGVTVDGVNVADEDGDEDDETFTYDFDGDLSANIGVIVRYTGAGFTTNCEVEISNQTVTVGIEPQPALSWVGITEGRQTSFQLTEENPALANGNVNYVRVVIDGVEAFEDFTPDLTVPYEFDNVFATSGTHMIEVEMGTNAGCQVNVSRNIEILGHLSGFDNLSSYSESFENGLGGWLIETVSIDGKSDDLPSTWTRTNAIPGAGGVDGSFAVITDNYQPSEVSFVYSPSIDLSGFASPTISFLRLVQFETFRDGVAFQISTDDGRTWENVGNFSLEFGSSPGWYNFEGITSAPGTVAPGPQAIASNNRQIGWTDQESDVWIEAKEAISVLAAEADSVRFRFALAAQAGDKSVTGFGFDNITIFDRDRIVLIEQFSSSLSASSISLNNRLDSTTTFIGTDVIRINYFTDLANTDTEQDGLNLRNTVDPGARSVLYGIDQASSVAIAGEASFLDPNVEDSWLTAVTQLGNAKLGNPRFRISISAAIVDNNINLGASFESLSNFTDPNTELSLNLAIIEPEVILTEAMGLYNAGDRVNNVMRQMLPDAAGEYRSGAIAVGDVLEISEITWPITGVFNPDTLTIVAFIQDINTNEIYQSAITGVSGGENVLSVNENLLSDMVVYPNPGDEQVTIDFINPLKKDSEWVLYDQSGRTMKKGELSKGHQQLLLDTKEAASKMYFFYLFQSNEPAAAVRLMIRH